MQLLESVSNRLDKNAFDFIVRKISILKCQNDENYFILQAFKLFDKDSRDFISYSDFRKVR